MKVGDKSYADKKEAGAALVEMCKEMKSVNVPATIGEYAGFRMSVSFDSINHALESMTRELADAKVKLENVERQLDTAKTEVTKPFAPERIKQRERRR